MPKCPACKKEIKYLHNDQTVWHRYNMGLSRAVRKNNTEFDANYVEIKQWPADENIYACPECDTELFYSEENAIVFLSGGNMCKIKMKDKKCLK